MFKYIKLAAVVLGLLASAGQVSAHVFPGGSLMTFDNGSNVSSTASIPGSMAASVFPSLGQSYVEQGIQHSAIGFGTPAGNSIGNFINPGLAGSHVHGEAAGGSRVSAYLSDSGGGLIKLVDGSNFGVGGLDVASMNFNLGTSTGPSTGLTTMTLRGYTSADFLSFVDVKLSSTADGLTPTLTQGICATAMCTEAGNAANGFNGTHLHLDNIADFQNIYLLEYFCDSVGRATDGAGVANLQKLAFRIDNVALTSPVPLPAAVYLFGTGIMGLFGAARRCRKASVISA